MSDVWERTKSAAWWGWNNKQTCLALVGGTVWLVSKFSDSSKDEGAAREEMRRQKETCSRAFYDTVRASDQLTVSTFDSLLDTLNERFDVEGMKKKLPTLSSELKRDAWKEMNVAVIARTMTWTYWICLLNSLFRILLTVRGKYCFMSSTIDPGGYQCVQLTMATQQRYLFCSQFLQNHGFKMLSAIVSNSVEGFLAQLPLDHKVTADDLASLLLSMRAVVEHNGLEALMFCMLPPEVADAFDPLGPGGAELPDPDVQFLMGETRRVLASEQFYVGLSTLLNSAFDNVTTHVQAQFPEGGTMALAKAVAAAANVHFEVLSTKEKAIAFLEALDHGGVEKVAFNAFISLR